VREARQALLAGLIALAGRLRDAEVSVSVADIADAACALQSLNDPTADEVRVVLRAVLVRRYEDLARFEAVWSEMLGGPAATFVTPPLATGSAAFGAADTQNGAGAAAGLGASADERLATADPVGLDAEAMRHAVDIAAAVAARAPRRVHHRLRRQEAGSLDLGRTLRHSLTTDAVPIVRLERGRPRRHRPWLIFIDASGSVKTHVLGWVIHACALARALPDVEVFTFGTRLTRLTPALRDPRPVNAIAIALAAVPDFAGGTRIGDALGQANRRFGSLSRGAVVMVVSDGCERGEADTLATELALLRRRAYRLIWANPLATAPGFEPLTGGMLAARPSIDDLIGSADELTTVDWTGSRSRSRFSAPSAARARPRV
jgi:uncharacterized protein